MDFVASSYPLTIIPLIIISIQFLLMPDGAWVSGGQYWVREARDGTRGVREGNDGHVQGLVTTNISGVITSESSIHIMK